MLSTNQLYWAGAALSKCCCVIAMYHATLTNRPQLMDNYLNLSVSMTVVTFKPLRSRIRNDRLVRNAFASAINPFVSNEQPYQMKNKFAKVLYLSKLMFSTWNASPNLLQAKQLCFLHLCNLNDKYSRKLQSYLSDLTPRARHSNATEILYSRFCCRTEMYRILHFSTSE